MARRKKNRKAGKARRRRNWGGYSFNPKRRSKKRRRKNWGGYSFNPKKKRRSNRRRRRNPGEILSTAMNHLKNDVPGGAMAGAFDTFLGDQLTGLMPGGALGAGVAKVVGGAALAAVAQRFLPSVGKYMPGFAAGMAAIGTKKILGSVMGTPLGMLEDLADAYGDSLSELVSGNGSMGELVSGGGTDGLGLVDIVTRQSPEEVAGGYA